jgi:hypothetical protein
MDAMTEDALMQKLQSAPGFVELMSSPVVQQLLTQMEGSLMGNMGLGNVLGEENTETPEIEETPEEVVPETNEPVVEEPTENNPVENTPVVETPNNDTTIENTQNENPQVETSTVTE